MQRLGHLELADLRHRVVHRALLDDEAAVEQHPHRLDRVERDTFGAGEDLLSGPVGQARHESGEELLHRVFGQRLEVERREVAQAGAPRRPAVGQLGPGERDHEERRVARPLEQVLDEVEQARVGPLHVLEREHGRVDVGEALEEEPPGGEQILLVARAVLGQAEQLREPRLDERALVGVGEVLLERDLELPERRRRLILLADPAAHPHHVGQRPVGHALAVGEAAAAVPVRDLGDPVEVLVELPREPRLADPGDAGHRDEVRLAPGGALVEEVLDPAQLAVAADERGLQALRLERAAGARDDAQRPPELHRLLLALQRVRAGVFVDDRLLGRAAGRVADQHGARLGGRLDPRGRVDEVAGDHSLPFRADRHRRLAGEHARPRAQLRRADLVAERRDRRDEIERGPYGPLGVVLGRGRRAPDGHHRVADELLDRAAVEADQSAAGVEVAREELPHLLGVARLGERREPDEVGEQDGDQAPLGGRGRRWRIGRGRRRRGEPGQRRAALATEACPGAVARAAPRAGALERHAAARAELRVVGVLDAAVRADGHV